MSELAVICTTLYLVWHTIHRVTATASYDEVVAEKAGKGSAARAAIRLTSSMTGEIATNLGGQNKETR